MSKPKHRPGGPPSHGPGQPTNKHSLVDDLRKTIQRRYKFSDPDDVKEKNKKNGRNKDDETVAERGKKRDRSGKILAQQHKDDSGHETGGEPKDDVWEQEMKALGGTAEDLELLADAYSESEVEGDTSQAGLENLNKGMKNILKEIALAQGEIRDDEASSGPKTNNETNGNSLSAEHASQQQQADKSGRGKKIRLVCEPKPDWYNVADADVDTTNSPKHTVSKGSIDELHEFAKSLLDEDNQKFKEMQQSSSANAFYNTVISSGTLSDKISALTLAVQESPIHNIKALETLIGLARKRSRSQAVDVLRALKDLFAQGSLLPESRKLYAFQAQPAIPFVLGSVKSWKRGNKLPRGLEQRHLVSWAFESWLKEQYFEVLKILEGWCNDEIEFSKARAVNYVFELLKERPEQESNLLRLLINKLGDPVKKIASQSSYLLMQLLLAHPAMKMVVVSAIETDFIFRPGQTLHGKYYAVVTLNQTALSGKEEDVATKLLDIYLGLFTNLLKTDRGTAKNEDDTDPLQGKGRKKKNQKAQSQRGQPQIEELRDKLISAILTGVNRAYPYTNSSASSSAAFTSHLDTLFKIAHSANFNTSIQSLMLIQQISHSSQHKASSDRFYRVLYESLLDQRLITASKQQLYLNLLHRALKADLSVKRVKAFVKRLVQVLSLHEPSFICGAFFLIQDLEKTFPSLGSLINEPEDHEGDDVEVFRDVLDEDDVNQADPVATNGPSDSEQLQRGHVYDAHKRAPEHANADNACLWELLPFLAHFHPSVSVSADHVLRHQTLPGKPDLNLHTLSHFLDRFVYRNPKLSSSGLRGSSIMQPMATDNSHAVLIAGTADGKKQTPVNSEQFRLKKSEEVAAEDVFFHQYFTSLKGKAENRDKLKKEKKRGDIDESEADDEDEIWKAMMQSAPDLEGDEFGDNDDVDLDLADLESDEGEGEDEDLSELENEDEPEGDDDEGVDIDPAFFDDGDDEGLMDMDVAADDEGDEDDDHGSADFAGFDSDADAPPPAAPAAKRIKNGKQPEEVAVDSNKAKKARSKKLKSLPTFASVEDYAKMLEDDEDEDR
ncbi:uncharacterized protein Z519_01751 [Cladophialophora bantiana CBS 173.52]|uniref:CCAAT-binding factor domain-containing protein n=1 Tax=Cladophialophora bantiana (strain ATCC 10958 / CBS 173.52 / CDC B-1940 / NIH 8579) TaxID=1442370 RepID=A0A0D2GIH2_CLAB1|nr:uncharacterized protein Z519_01751 [Cladophialophora bantiana CBS 173.52]KIW98167.1 hypothetical protein Z519_01751 [Cladophialophora bantiana CBS 173.52]